MVELLDLYQQLLSGNGTAPGNLITEDEFHEVLESVLGIFPALGCGATSRTRIAIVTLLEVLIETLVNGDRLPRSALTVRVAVQVEGDEVHVGAQASKDSN